MTQNEIEDYFIQFCFCKNRQLLRQEFRKLYDALFEKYKEIHIEAREKEITDLNLINEKFVKTL